MPCAMAWTRKKPRTAMTRADSSSVVATTRSCNDRCQRLRSWAAIRCCQRRWAHSLRLTLVGIRRRISRPRSERPNAVIQPIRRSSLPAATFIDLDLSRPRLVADAANGDDNLGMLRVLLDLGPEPLHMDIDQPGVGGVPVTPHLLQQHLAGEDLARFASQRH